MSKNGQHETTFDARIDSITESMKDLVDQLGARASAMKAKSVEIKDEAKSRTTHAVEKLAATIAKYPFMAIGIAVGAGYLVARIARSR